MFKSKEKGAYFCLSIFLNLSWAPDINFAKVSGHYFLKAVKTMYLVMISHFGQKKPKKSPDLF